jgi:hypothetical protein
MWLRRSGRRRLIRVASRVQQVADRVDQGGGDQGHHAPGIVRCGVLSGIVVLQMAVSLGFRRFRAAPSTRVD